MHPICNRLSNWWRFVTDRDYSSLFVSLRHVGDQASSSAHIYECLLCRYFRTRNIVTLLSLVYLSCLLVVITCHKLSPLLMTHNSWGVLDIYVPGLIMAKCHLDRVGCLIDAFDNHPFSPYPLLNFVTNPGTSPLSAKSGPLC